MRFKYQSVYEVPHQAFEQPDLYGRLKTGIGRKVDLRLKRGNSGDNMFCRRLRRPGFLFLHDHVLTLSRSGYKNMLAGYCACFQEFRVMIQFSITSMSILVLKKHSKASSGEFTMGSFSLKEVFNKTGTPVLRRKASMRL